MWLVAHNESRQATLEHQKDFYRKDFKSKNHLRSASQPKLTQKAHVKERERFDLHVSKEVISEAKGTLGTVGSMAGGDGQEKEGYVDCLPKIEPSNAKKAKNKVRKEKETEEYVLKRKLTAPNPESGGQQDEVNE